MTARAILCALVLVAPTLVGSGVAGGQEADPAGSLSVFPSELRINAGRGEVVERTFGVTQTGQPQRELRFDVTGDAASFVTIVDPAAPAVPLESIVVSDAAPSYVVVRVAPPTDGPQGSSVARIRLVDVLGSVTVGSELRVAVDVDGTYDFAATLLGATAASKEVEQGSPLRVRLDVDVTGSAPLVPEVSATFRGPSGSVHDVVARPPTVAGKERSTIEVTWLTAGWDLGTHGAEVVLRNGTIEVGRAPVEVEIVAPGSTQPAVTVLGAELVSKAPPGGVAKVVVRARNDGAVDGRVVFVGDLLVDTTVIRPARSEPVVVAPGEIAELAVLAQLGDPATYRLRGRANLDGAESSLVSVDIEVRAANGRPWGRYALVLGVALVIAGALVVRARRRALQPSPRRSGTGPSRAGTKARTPPRTGKRPPATSVVPPSGVRLKARR